jgi:hypothetical protein
MILRGSLGLGDAIYLYPVVKYYIDQGQDVTIITRYPEIYATLNCKTVRADEFIDCSCSARTLISETNIFQDTLIMSGIKEEIPLNFDFKRKLIPEIKTDKPICVVRLPTAPTGGEDDAKVLIPDIAVFQNIINNFKNEFNFIGIGWQKNYFTKFYNLTLDFSDIADLNYMLSILDRADIVLTQPGHCVSIAEALGKKLFVVFANAGLQSKEKRFRFTTPRKILTKKTSIWCIDNELSESYLEKFKKLALND